MKNYDCGIDLGTTNSCIAVAEISGRREVIKNSDEMDVTPSVVQVSKKGRITVGQRAYTSPHKEQVRREFKRDMGTDVHYTFPDSGKVMTPIELSAEVLKKLRGDAQQKLDRELTDVIITVPAAFHEIQIKATKEAAKLAGFREIILLQEPVAASIAYGAKPDVEDQYWLVYDYGGGTLDCAVVTTKDHELSVINSKGNNRMGGKDIDQAVYEKIVLPRLRKEYSEIFADGNPDPVIQSKAMFAVEDCKKDLSRNETSIYELFDDDADIEFSMEITRRLFNEAVQDIIEDTVDIAMDAVIGAKIRPADLTKIILVGGSTQIPLVRDLLRDTFHNEIDTSLNPMTVVAEGAAMYAAATYVDSEVSVETETADSAVELHYDTMVTTEEADVCGRFMNYVPGSIAEICISSVQEDLWTGGWTELLNDETGSFAYEVFLYDQNRENHYRLHARDAYGSEINILAPEIVITYGGGLKLAAPPLPFHIGVRAEDDKGPVVDWLISKNTRLPTEKRKTYYLNKDLRSNCRDTFSLVIYEGEDTINPNANSVVGELNVNSLELNRELPKGTEIEICIQINISREVEVTAYIPEYDMILTHETLMGGDAQYKNPETERQKIQNDIKETDEKLVRLSEAGIDISEEKKKVDKAKGALEKCAENQDDNDAQEKAVQDFRDAESCVIKKERDNQEKIRSYEDENLIQQYKKDTAEYGMQKHLNIFKDLEKKYRSEDDAALRKFYLEKMRENRNNALWSSMKWLTETARYFANSHEAFSDEQKAAFWKKKAEQAIVEDKYEELEEAVSRLYAFALWDESTKMNRPAADIHL